MRPIGLGLYPKRRRHRLIKAVVPRPVVSTDTLVGDVFFALCKNCNSPTSLALWMLYSSGDHQAFVQHSIDPLTYHDANWNGPRGPNLFANDYNCVEFLSKYKGLRTGVDTRSVALAAFADCELKCAETNLRFKDPTLRGIPSRVHSVLHGAARKIVDILGDIRSVRISDCGWGPGSTYSLDSRNSTLVHKLREEQLSVTIDCLNLAQIVVGHDIHWAMSRDIDAAAECTLLASEFKISRGNKVVTVSKNAKTDRVIAQEPTMNIFIQKAFGKHIRKRLARFGVDLNDQSRNQELARMAMEYGLATVDLKAASDTISRGVVSSLLPPDWHDLLDAIRSHYYHDGSGVWKKYHKWSSMGNGYTFELESMIFYAIAQSCHDLCCDANCVVPSVYGDDVIIHQDALLLFTESIKACGFEVNSKKTHYASGFRESCGKHYFYGVDVTPIYQKEIPDVLEEVYRLANRVRRLAARKCPDSVSYKGLRSAWERTLRSIPNKLHLLPLGTSEDSGLVFSREDFISFGKPIPGDHGGRIRKWVFKPKSYFVRNDPLYAYWLRFTPPTAFSGKVSANREGIYVDSRQPNYLAPQDAPW